MSLFLGVVGAVCVILGAVTTPRCRSAFSVKVATLGLGGAQVEPATKWARLVFMDLSQPLSDGKVTNEFVGRARDVVEDANIVRAV